MRRWMIFVLTLLLVAGCLVVPATAAEEREYRFELEANGLHEIQGRKGDIVTITLTLCRADAALASPIHGVQAELIFDGEELELLDGSCLLAPGVETRELELMGGEKALYMSFLSLNKEGELWEPRTLMGSFQLRVLAEQGTVRIRCEDYSVSRPDGSGSYPVLAENLTICLTPECLVRFEMLDEGDDEELLVPVGSLLTEPEIPKRRGYEFAGWYKDIHLTQPWNFASDTVGSNLTLYAAWTENETAAVWTWLLPILGAGIVLLLGIAIRRKRINT